MALPASSEQSSSTDGPVTWSCLPQKSQLLILFFCRLFDSLQVISLQSYAFYQLKSFAPDLSDSTISWQGGVLYAAYPATQFLTAMIWGYIGDSSWMGRKNTLLVGLIGTGVSCIGLAFSGSFIEAVVWRLGGGAVNGTVGIVRTMISENVSEKKFLPRAFTIPPLSFYVAACIGPVIGGFLCNPIINYPEFFGPGTFLGGPSGPDWMRTYPYALPAIYSTTLLFLVSVVVFFGLDETLDSRKHSFDLGKYLSTEFIQLLQCIQRRNPKYHSVSSDDPASRRRDVGEFGDPEPKDIRQVIFVMFTEAFFDFHMGAFSTVLVLFLCSPRVSPSTSAVETALGSGLSFSARSTGLALALVGIIGIPAQLLLYPAVHRRLGTLRCYQLFAMLFPLVYTITPFLVFVPPSEGWLMWTTLIIFLIIHTIGRIFTFPATIYLLNNCAPHPSVLGTVHGIGQSVSAAFRTLGSVAGGLSYAWGMDLGIVGLAFWLTTALPALVACLLLRWVREGG